MARRGPYKRKPVEAAPARRWNAGFPVLSPDQVRGIRVRLGEGATQYRLAKEHGVSAQAIRKIALGISHKGVV